MEDDDPNRLRGEWREGRLKSVLWFVAACVFVLAGIPAFVIMKECCYLEQMRGNELAALRALIEYAHAQQQFRARRLGKIAGNAETQSPDRYCDNFRNLHYGVDAEGKRLELISKEMADAFVASPAGASTAGDAPTTPRPYNGYVFLEDPAVKIGDWTTTHALVAFPAPGNGWNYTAYWIGPNNVVMQCAFEPKSSHDVIRANDSPLVNPKSSWVVVG